ncbi:YybH family protein [Roseateles violae]|uniref:SgcJ/EcaC family oxidoreductase n=1 Tax=Roseateles violae TaxID=3058042 RepID=A0ABT8DTM6_9BURK|nr:SgcJ/EcaC family oxidoreductase [Pelomonas sp. PFR6]MDN3921426.1 SgcJ/EcaC family oxidoreductase [Pelomonas sp. PFR6]
MDETQRDEEAQIRALLDQWMAATRAGRVEEVLALVAEDAVFLMASRGPMDKAEFARLSRAQAGAGAPTIDGHSEIAEIQLALPWAFIWTRLRVRVTPPGGATMERAGHTLTVLSKATGRWQIARDANMLAPVSG